MNGLQGEDQSRIDELSITKMGSADYTMAAKPVKVFPYLRTPCSQAQASGYKRSLVPSRQLFFHQAHQNQFTAIPLERDQTAEFPNNNTPSPNKMKTTITIPLLLASLAVSTQAIGVKLCNNANLSGGCNTYNVPKNSCCTFFLYPLTAWPNPKKQGTSQPPATTKSAPSIRTVSPAFSSSMYTYPIPSYTLLTIRREKEKPLLAKKFPLIYVQGWQMSRPLFQGYWKEADYSCKHEW